MCRQSKGSDAIFWRVLALLAVGWCGMVQAQVPHKLNYQGYLTNAGGTPVTTPQTMVFKLYAVPSGGAALYTETQTVAVNAGVFDAVIGAVTPLNLAFDVPYYLGVSAGADPEMTPRQLVTASPYALRSANADALAPAATVGGAQITGLISSATLPTANLTGTIPTSSLSGTIGNAQIGNNAVTQAKLSPVSGAAAGKVLGTDGTNLQWQTAGSGIGTVTSVGTGTGLTGGPITTSGTINLAATQLLPTIACAANQVPKWTGSAWACTADNNSAVGGLVGEVLTGTGGAAEWSGSPSLSGNLTLASPSLVSSGNIMKGANTFIHNYGSSNTFVGESAGNFSMGGSQNSATGFNALKNNAAGGANMANGAYALSNNADGHDNTASGTFALYHNTFGNDNTANGSGSLFANMTGNENTASGVNALGSNSTGSYNTAIGTSAMYINTTGASNTATGRNALYANTTGSENTAIGIGSLESNTTGNDNTASGGYSLQANTTGNDNTASGHGALHSNTIGFSNTASGVDALTSNTTGNNNMASGVDALTSNTTGNNNTASGAFALYANTTGIDNSASGALALSSNTTGSDNTASGAGALYLNTTGSHNIGVGISAGYDLTSGSFNIDIGNQGFTGEGNTIRIGDANQTRTFIAGIRGITTGLTNAVAVFIDGNGQLGTANSSRRVKDNIADMDAASNALMKLRPVTFHYKGSGDVSSRTLQYGLIAEEVAEVAPGLVAHKANGEVETVYYQFLAPMLLNEYQKQQRTIEAQAAEMARQTTRIAELEQDRRVQIARIDALGQQATEVAMLRQQVAQLALQQQQAAARSALQDPPRLTAAR